MSEEKFWLYVWSLITSTTIVIVFTACLFNYLGQRDLLKAGFNRKVVPGYSAAIWTKD